jgi:hypothetical protein
MDIENYCQNLIPKNILLKSVAVSVILNITLSIVFKFLIKKNILKYEKINKYKYFKQFIDMMIDHNDTKIVSSLIIAIIVFISVLIAKK